MNGKPETDRQKLLGIVRGPGAASMLWLLVSFVTGFATFMLVGAVFGKFD